MVSACWISSKTSLKIGSVNKAFCFDIDKKYFLGMKHFCFSREKAETFSMCLKNNFVKPPKISTQRDNQ